MTQVHIAHDGTAHVCYATTTGIDRAYFGCAHASPREAIAHADALADPASRSGLDALPQTAAGEGHRAPTEAPETDPASRLPLPGGSGSVSGAAARRRASSPSASVPGATAAQDGPVPRT